MVVMPSYGNQYDPHVFPDRGPFFEGWYARMTDVDNQRSFGVLFGEVLPGEMERGKETTPTTYIGLIRSDGRRPMVAAEGFPKSSDIRVTVRKAYRSAHLSQFFDCYYVSQLVTNLSCKNRQTLFSLHKDIT